MHFQHPIKRFKRFFFVKSSQHKRRVYKDSTILLDWINTVQTTWSGKGGGTGRISQKFYEINIPKPLI